MARCPFAKWRGPLPAANFATAAQAGSASKIGLAFHVIVGSEDSADSEFHNGGVHLSSTFGIADGTDGDDADGDLIQWVDTDDVVYCQGAGNWPPHAYVSCETAGTPDKPMTPAQVRTATLLTVWCSATLGFPIVFVPHGTPGVITHCNPDGSPDPAYGNHPCPGLTRLAQVRDVIVPAAASGTTGLPTGVIMGKFNLISHKVDPRAPLDPKNRVPTWGCDPHGNLFALNGARGIRGLGALGIVRNDIAGMEVCADGNGVILFAADDGGTDGAEYVCSTFVLRVGA